MTAQLVYTGAWPTNTLLINLTFATNNGLPQEGGWGGRVGNPQEFDFMKRIQVGILTSTTVPRVGNLTQRPLGKWRRPGKEHKVVRHIGKYPVVTWMSFLLQDSLGFWILTVDSRLQVLDSRFFVRRTWIPDSNHWWVSGFVELSSEFQSPKSRFDKQKNSWIMDYKSKIIPDSGFPYMGWSFPHAHFTTKGILPLSFEKPYSHKYTLFISKFAFDLHVFTGCHRQVFVKAKDKKIICTDIKISVFVLRSLWKEGFSQGEVDHLFSTLVLPNFTYGLPVYGAADSDLLDRCFKRKYTSKRMDIRELLEKADKKLFKVRSVDPDCPLSNIIPKKEERKELLRNKSAHRPDIKTNRFKNVFVNRIIFRYNFWSFYYLHTVCLMYV